MRQKATGLVTSTLVQVDLDGAGTDTSLNSRVADIDAIANISATATANKLQIAADICVFTNRNLTILEL